MRYRPLILYKYIIYNASKKLPIPFKSRQTVLCRVISFFCCTRCKFTPFLNTSLNGPHYTTCIYYLWKIKIFSLVCSFLVATWVSKICLSNHLIFAKTRLLYKLYYSTLIDFTESLNCLENILVSRKHIYSRASVRSWSSDVLLHLW